MTEQEHLEKMDWVITFMLDIERNGRWHTVLRFGRDGLPELTIVKRDSSFVEHEGVTYPRGGNGSLGR